MQEKLRSTNLKVLQNYRHLFLSKEDDGNCNKIRGGLFAFLLFFFSVAGYSQLATESFESGIPASWTRFQNSFGVSSWGTIPDGYLGGNAAYVNPAADNIGASNTAQYYLVTPLLSVPANGEIRFLTKQGSATNLGTVYELRVSTTTSNINDFGVLLQSWDETTLNTSATTYEEKVVTIPTGIPTGTQIYLAFVAKNTQPGAVPSGDSWFVDNVRVIEGCLKVQSANFTVSNITSTGATLAWTHPTATNFDIQIVPQGSGPASSGTPTGTSYVATGLTAATNYDVFIRTICDASTASGWAGPFPMRTSIIGTACTDPIVISPTEASPYILNSNLNLYQNASVVYTTQGTGCLSPAVTGNYLNGAKAFFKLTPTQTGLINVITNPLGSAGGSGCFANTNTGTFIYQDCASVGFSCLAGISTNAVGPKQISNFYVQAGQTYFIVLSSSLSATASICFNFRVEYATCAPPAVYTYKNLQQTTVSFSWNNAGNLASAWEYLVLPAASAAPTVATSGTPTSTNTDNAISGLTAATAYKLYVRSVCGGTPGAWGTGYAFKTQCDMFSTPYTTAFTGTSATVSEPCWTPIDVNNDGLTWSYLSSEATMQTSTNQNYNYDMFASPQVNFTGVQKRLRYKYRMAGSGSAKYSVRISTTGVGSADFVTELLPETSVTNTALVEKIINIPTSFTGPINIAFVVAPGTGQTATRINIDDVFIEDKPACSNPITPVAQNITTTSADLKWIKGDVETQWEVVIQPLGTGAPTGSGTLVSVGDANVTLNGSDVTYTPAGLNPATRYEYYVRAYCSSALQSSWVGPINFTTLCVAVNAPYLETFNDSDPTTKKFCWSTNNVDGGVGWSITAGGEADIRRGFGTPSGYNDWLISPAINAVGNKKLSFKYRALMNIFASTIRHGVEVLISTTDTNPASFSVIMPWTEFNNSTYQERSLYFTGNGTVYIAFRVPPGVTSPGLLSTLNIDDVKIEDAPACPNPFNIASANVTADTATLSWGQGYAETQWQVVVQPQGTGTPTGSGTLVGVGTPNFNFTAPTATYGVTGLAPATNYEVYVRAYCDGTNQSEWVGPVNFRTLCAPINTPFAETFDSNSTTENCWRVVNQNNDNTTWTLNNTTYPYEGDNAAAMFTGTNGANNDWLISPTFNVTANQRLRYYYRVNYFEFTEDLNVKLSTNGIALSEFTTTLYDSSTDPVLINNEVYKEKIINLPPGITGNINIAFQVPFHTPMPEGYRGQLLVIDNVIIEDIPACSQASNVVSSNLTDTSVQLSWAADTNVSTWEVSVQPYGSPAPVGNTNPSYLHTTTTNSITINGLTPAIRYEYYVRSICGSNQTEWLGPYEFTTRCSYVDLCEYTITLYNGANGSGPAGPIQLIQNGVVLQEMTFPSSTPSTQAPPRVFTVFLCNGVEFSLFWDAIGTVPNQWPNAYVTVANSSGTVVWTSPIGLGTPRRVMYTGVSSCSAIACPQPTNLAVNNQSVLSWTAGGTETQWEVFIQPVGFGALPQSGTLVGTNSYTPTAADFANANASTYEYFVRAVCGSGNTSFWSGPFEFVRNDEPANAIVVPVNETDDCTVSGTDVSFIGATPTTTVPSGCVATNNGDIWLQFTATQKIHIIEVNGFTGPFYYASGDLPYPDIMMTLYKQETDGTLTQIACSNNNAITAMYSSELIPGQNYKVRLALNGASPNGAAPNSRLFNLCVRTPENFCDVDAVNYDFEQPAAPFGGVDNFCTQYVVPGWRHNWLTWSSIFFAESATTSASGYYPYSGGQAVQLVNDPEADWNPTDMVNVRGHYKDFDTSEITQMDYSFAHAARSVSGTSIQLLAGPPSGPFTLVAEHLRTGTTWELIQGSYMVPAGQNNTRFIFRTKENKIGHMLDAANFKAFNGINTQDMTLTCSQTSVTVDAEGTGQWIADAANPAVTIIETPNVKTTVISGFNTPGVYVYHWKTRYCDKTITITYQGISDVATVSSPANYCVSQSATPLTATAPAGYTLMWYTQAVGGTGSATAPTPDVSIVGSTDYYVSVVDPSGCIGPRTLITAQVNALPTATMSGTATICSGENAAITFTGTPNALVTYTVNGGTSQIITIGDTGTITLDAIALTANTVYDLVSVMSTGDASCTVSLSQTVNITVKELPTATISGEATICNGETTVILFTGTPGAIVTYTVDGAADQTITLDTSGEAQIPTPALTENSVYTLVEVMSPATSCVQTLSESVTITVLTALEIDITGECEGASYTITAVSLSGSFNPDAVTYLWSGPNGFTAATQSVVITSAGIYNVTVTTTEGCTLEYSESITPEACLIPKGISPNNDGLNDNWNLDGMNARKVSIFNRYGATVYEHGSGYTNQWYGQSKGGDELPDG
ncbi:choice-of-anchor J domain-containing protein, partial [Flavobacterium enshiense]|uniref:choice-of-anchor J domain-containing protein n=1 Tax=Flavobacterium enshiense TaxID=1341165 RepID=UPI00345C72F9